MLITHITNDDTEEIPKDVRPKHRKPTVKKIAKSKKPSKIPKKIKRKRSFDDDDEDDDRYNDEGNSLLLLFILQFERNSNTSSLSKTRLPSDCRPIN
jgi:hypothetical protein